MTRQSEQVLEEQLVAQLQQMGYAYVTINNERDLLANLKIQLEKHNRIQFSDKEFDRVLNLLSKGSIFEKAKTLREKQHITRDNGESLYFEFIQQEHWCQNEFQVTQQVTMEGTYQNRYDVTLLINGLPLVQIELKRKGLELKEAFNQVRRYNRHSFGSSAALFQYLQLFVISNGVNTKYYSNNRELSFRQTFYWTDKENKRLTSILNGFTADFLEPCNLSKMICRYIVLSEAKKMLMILRPYQFYAVEALVEKVKNNGPNGYVWHTTGSGKTLTSFKAAQLLTALPQVTKVVFVVDRKDLDYQTTKEFNSFSAGSIDGTDNTRQLVRQFADGTKLIVTTIQKLNTAISKAHYQQEMQRLQDEKMVFIFDECHRSQFGETHRRITGYFRNAQLFGFTGTPIFADNAVANELGKRTTKELFGDCLHKYVITDAIRDENVLKFSVEYVGRYRQKEDSRSNIDIEVEDIDTQELMDHPSRLEKITDYIIANHARKTHSGQLTGMFCVSSVDTLIRYYEAFRRKREAGEHNLRVATIFSYEANQGDDSDGLWMGDDAFLAAEDQASYGTAIVEARHTREKLDEFITHYNADFGVKYSTKDSASFYNYYNDISQRVKEGQIDILLVVNMFLTGFDSPRLNTLYVDKNLKYHGLIQAYSRTNRLYTEQKSQGNVVAFRNLKQKTDEAIELFSNKEAIDEIIMEPYEHYEADFKMAYDKLLQLVPTVDSVNDLQTEQEELDFVKAFRELMRLRNVLITFADFSWDEQAMSEQEFENYKSKYLDLYDKVRFNSQKEKVSILEDVDFELELIHRDEINVNYILKLLGQLHTTSADAKNQKHKEILDLLAGDANLRSKRELIEAFIRQHLPVIEDADLVPEAFERFWKAEQEAYFERLCKDERLSADRTRALLEHYLYAEQDPLRKELIDLIEGEKPGVIQLKSRAEGILAQIKRFVETFDKL